MNILLINGPNLNLLGTREKELYGSKSLEDIQQDLVVLANEHQCNLFTFQSNAEHEIIDSIHGAVEAKIDFVIINPAAYTHTSIAIRDAFLGVNIPFYEVHLSEIQTREKYRHFSYLSDIAEEVITGLGAKGYEEAMLFLNCDETSPFFPNSSDFILFSSKRFSLPFSFERYSSFIFLRSDIFTDYFFGEIKQ